jgi:hypothetical protein
MPIYEIRDSTGTLVWPGNHQPAFEDFPPGRSETYWWDQRNHAGSYVDPDEYHITAYWFVVDSAPRIEGDLADTIWVVDMSHVLPPIPTSWGRVKSLYR